MSSSVVSSLLDMSKQKCNYCKGFGHRIHAINPQGVYIKSADGERVLACPVLLKKETVLQKTKNVDEEFPALPGQSGGPSIATVAIMQGIAGAAKEKKQRAWALGKAEKEDRERAKSERARLGREEHGRKMEDKYGPRWAWVVKDTAEDNEIASSIRYNHEEAVRLWEDEMDSIQQEMDRKCEEEYAEKKAERAVKTDEMEELEEELENEWNAGCVGHEYSLKIHNESIQKEKVFYEKKGWTWVERW